MKPDHDLSRQLLDIFADEAQEHLQATTEHLLALEKAPASPEASRLLTETFRRVHSLKGAARAVNLPGVAALAHQLESLLSRVQDGQVQLGEELYNASYAVLDAISALARTDVAGSAAKVDVPALCARLEAVSDGQEAARSQGPSEAHAPALAAPDRDGSAREQHPVQAARPPETELVADAQAKLPEPGASLGSRTVRIATSKLDSLMEQLGELQITRNWAEQHIADVHATLEHMESWGAAWQQMRGQSRKLLSSANGSGPEEDGRHPDGYELRSLVEFLEASETHLQTTRTQLANLHHQGEANFRQFAQVLTDIQNEVRQTYMLPAATVFDAFPRMVRDLAHELDRDVRLVIHGADTEVDRTVLEQMKDPLVALLRNAVDHGLEEPSARQAAAKPQEGTITLTAAQQSGSILIEVSDDGAGIDLAQVRARAIEEDILTEEAANALGDRDALRLIFSPGLSTSQHISEVSGRGMGLDIVQSHVQQLGGIIDVDSSLGQGTRFQLSLPLTVATTVCLLVQAGGQTLALPTIHVIRVLQLERETISYVGGDEVVLIDGQPAALLQLADLLALAPTRHPALQDWPTGQQAIVLGMADKRLVLLVDAVLGIQEVVTKPLPLLRASHIAGVTILGTGEIALVPNVVAVLQELDALGTRPVLSTVGDAATGPATILVADDSLTTCMLTKGGLAAAGYQVQTVTDGREAWGELQRDGYDLLVSDVQMPHMDGFELVAKVRADAQLKDLPVVLVTSLSADADRQRGKSLGADAYIVKGAAGQSELLKNVQRLLAPAKA